MIIIKKSFYILFYIGLSITTSCDHKKESNILAEASIVEEALKLIERVQNLDKRFVTAVNGLNYRDEPNGTVLGKFMYNTELDIVEYTSNEQDIIDNGKTINGTWVGVQNDKDTVYVFDAYLSISKDVTLLIDENEYHITIDALFKDPWDEDEESIVQELSNEATVSKEIKLKDFVTITEVSQKGFEIVSKKNSKSKDHGLIKKDSILSINCLNGEITEFKDKHTEYDEEIEEYYYSTTFEKINTHVIYLSGWEWGETYFVNYKTCDTLKINGYPIFNKDYSKMICFDSDLENETIFINSFDGFKFSPKYQFSIPVTSNRVSIDSNEDFYAEYISEWNDGEQNKVSRQYFKFEFIY